MEPVAKFTHWAGQSTNPTVPQIYPKVHSMVAAVDTFITIPARDLCQSLLSFIEANWSFKDIPDAILLGTFLNPSCAALSVFDTTLDDTGKTLRDKAKELAMNAHDLMNEKNSDNVKMQDGAQH